MVTPAEFTVLAAFDMRDPAQRQALQSLIAIPPKRKAEIRLSAASNAHRDYAMAAMSFAAGFAYLHSKGAPLPADLAPVHVERLAALKAEVEGLRQELLAFDRPAASSAKAA
ncbi:hypothetical protein [Caulobacter hibisci]|uniref:Uncharacterized protein n=1 Tax=Caulobacter hibisci TaxID=2035993 RepID=A0ABS0SUH2_9CAUL|nr:hypothetical protein [Caulobacter hibisci]MBI1682348.1 hypothetical protein [Caulobacter hibisci]